MTDTTYVLNAGLQVLRSVPWYIATTGIVSGKVWVLKSHPDKLVRSQYLTLNMPIWVVEYKYVHLEYDKRVAEVASMDAIMRRDKGRCCYCGKKADSIDHVVPKSMGGPDTWRNLVAACSPCNQKKANRLPEEVGMPMLWTPEHVDPLAKVQKQVWSYIDSINPSEFERLSAERTVDTQT